MADVAAIAPASRRWFPPSWLWIVPPLFLIALFFLYPLGLIFDQALTGDASSPTMAYFAALTP